MKELKNPKEKVKFITDLYEKGIVTDSVLKQLIFLIDREEQKAKK